MTRHQGLGGRAAGERRLHEQQLRGYGFLAGRGPRPSATVVPAPLRYWQYDPPRPVPVGVVLGIVAIWLGVFAWGGGWTAMVDEAPLAVGAGLIVLVLNVGRLTVTDHGVSTDVPATRTKPESIVPLVLVREVRVGAVPPGWPTAAGRGGWLPGRTRVAVRHLADDGATEQACTRWIRDPEAFAEALDHPLQAPTRRS
ncbi:hypothetical protein [Blastococcus deserti]|uniref:DUF3093 family protein n=1 Tax=Blastococcus deserti TaxID=2259033 RepID=A0ABW4XFP4_9ACTN